MTTPTDPQPFAQLYPGDRVHLPEDDDTWGPVRHITEVRHSIAHTGLPITTVWWQAPHYTPNCAAFTGETFARGFLRAAHRSADTEDPTLREALQRTADGRSA